MKRHANFSDHGNVYALTMASDLMGKAVSNLEGAIELLSDVSLTEDDGDIIDALLNEFIVDIGTESREDEVSLCNEVVRSLKNQLTRIVNDLYYPSVEDDILSNSEEDGNGGPYCGCGFCGY